MVTIIMLQQIELMGYRYDTGIQGWLCHSSGTVIVVVCKRGKGKQTTVKQCGLHFQSHMVGGWDRTRTMLRVLFRFTQCR